MSFSGMLKDGTLADKVIIVTGGGTGLGKSMSKYFLELGAKVVITSRKEDVLIGAKKELENLTGGSVHYVVGDVRDIDDVKKTIDSTIDKYGGFNALLNNAAGNFISPTENLSAKAFDTVVDIVLKGTYNYSLETGKCIHRLWLCCSFSLREGWRFNTNSLTSLRMGKIWYKM